MFLTPKTILQQANAKTHKKREVTRDRAIDKTRAERIWERTKVYIIFHPSQIENGEH